VPELIDALRRAAGEIRFGVPVQDVRVDGQPVIHLQDGDELLCDFVLGCDGFHGVTRPALKSVSCNGVDFGAEWLSILAEAPPSGELTVYGLHPDGFAGHMLRSATVSRFYLQIEPGSRDDRSTDEEIWERLAVRLAADRTELTRGKILEMGTLELRSYVSEPMQQDHVFLAGDAAHIVTPAGGKGMNLALQDANELVKALVDHYRRQDDRRLYAYSATRIPAVWRSVELSHWMLDLLLARPREGRFREGLRDTRLAQLMAGGLFAREFAVNYVGCADAG
jgi:p-hydroxybenzoate 3-monooxygenase